MNVEEMYKNRKMFSTFLVISEAGLKIVFFLLYRIIKGA